MTLSPPGAIVAPRAILGLRGPDEHLEVVRERVAPHHHPTDGGILRGIVEPASRAVITAKAGGRDMVFNVLILWALALQTAPPAVIVRASGDCPSAQAVNGALARLIAPTDAPRPADLAEIEVQGGTLAISLSRTSGEVIGHRELAAPPGCADRAEAVAIVLAAWETHLGDRAAQDLQVDRRLGVTPPPVAATNPAVPAPAPPARSFVSSGAATPPVQSAGPAGLRASAAVGGVAGETRRFVWEPGGSLFASVDVNDSALGAAAELALSRDGSPFALGGSALFVASHATTVSPGIGSWRRFGVVVDGRRRAVWPNAWLEARIGVALTALTIGGRGLAEESGGSTLDPGALGGLRVGLTGERAVSWLEVAMTFWPRSQIVYVRNGGSADLPWFEALIGVGLSWGRR
jgi:hypothetical protein